MYLDTKKGLEMARISTAVRNAWEQGAYLNEIFLRRSHRGEQSVTEHSLPKPKSDLVTLATKLHRDYEVERIQRSMERPQYGTSHSDGGGTDPFVGQWVDRTRPPGLSGSTTGNLGWSVGAGMERPTPTTEQTANAENVEQLLSEYAKEAEAWINRARACAWEWYQEDLKIREATAQEQAQRALGVDFSALRGRGPEFVREFTALVVIIFGAVILGVVGILSGEQIGTLLAAIAGYVLGKQSARGRSAASEEKAPAQPSQLEVTVTAPKGGAAGLEGASATSNVPKQ